MITRILIIAVVLFVVIGVAYKALSNKKDKKKVKKQEVKAEEKKEECVECKKEEVKEEPKPEEKYVPITVTLIPVNPCQVPDGVFCTRTQVICASVKGGGVLQDVTWTVNGKKQNEDSLELKHGADSTGFPRDAVITCTVSDRHTTASDSKKIVCGKRYFPDEK